jgi:hypothetical protein
LFFADSLVSRAVFGIACQAKRKKHSEGGLGAQMEHILSDFVFAIESPRDVRWWQGSQPGQQG